MSTERQIKTLREKETRTYVELKEVRQKIEGRKYEKKSKMKGSKTQIK